VTRDVFTAGNRAGERRGSPALASHDTHAAGDRRFHDIAQSLSDYYFTVIVKNGLPVETLHGDGCLALTGYSPEAFRSNPNLWIEIVPLQDRPLVEAQIRKIYRECAAEPLTHRIVRQDGTLRWVTNTPVLHLDGNGRLASYDGIIRDVTEEVLAGEALRESEARYRALVELSPDGIGVIINQSVAFINTAGARMLGAGGPETIVGKRVMDFVHPDSRDQVSARIRMLLDGQQENALREEVFVRLDGSVFHAEVATTATVFEHQRAIQVFFRDVTARKQAEKSLRLQSAALESAANAILVADRNGAIMWVNSAFTRLTGYTAAEVVGQNPRLLKSGKHPREFYENLWSTILSGREWHAEIINRRKDGSLYTEESSVTPVRDEMGDIRHFVAVKQDITARKREAKEAKRLAAIVESSDDAIIGMTGNGTIFSWNQGAEKIYQYGEKEMLGRNIRILNGDQPSTLFESLQDMVQRGDRSGYTEMSRLRKDGRVVYVSISVSPVKDEAGRIVATSEISRNITSRKSTEMALRASEATNQALLNAIPDTIVRLDGEGRVLDVRAPRGLLFASDPTGVLEREQGAQSLARDLMPLGDMPELRTRVLRILKSREPETIEYRLANGAEMREYEARMTPCGEKEVLALIRDITDLKNTERALTEQQTQLRAMAHALNVAEEEERHRLAAELHDQIGQLLATCRLKVDRLQKTSRMQALRNNLENVREMLDQAIRETRTLTFELSSPDLHELGLAAAIDHLCQRMSRQYDVDFTCEYNRQPFRVDREIRIMLYRAAKELLFNITKHANARHAIVKLTRQDDAIRMVVEDDGTGFADADSRTVMTANGGFGLFHIRERLRHLGGSLAVVRRDGGGTRIVLSCPAEVKTRRQEGPGDPWIVPAGPAAVRMAGEQAERPKEAEA
jgi:PAS domain S-box-containing protein